MGQKVNPYVQRIGINRNWRSLWYADRKDYQVNVIEDAKIRAFIARNFLFTDGGFEYEDSASFLEAGIIDSYGFMELLHWVEEEFSMSVADDELVPDNFDSVHDLSAFIVRRKSDGA